MERSGLLLSGDNKALATMLPKVLRHGVEPFFATEWWDGGGKCYCQRVKLGDTSDPCGQRAREKLHLRSPQRQAMIRRRAGNARRRLHHVQPVHLAVSATDFYELIQFAAARKFSRVPDVSRTAAEKIGVQREDYIRFFRTINRVDVISKRQLRAFACAVADRWFPLMPFGLWIECKDRLDLRRQRRRSDNGGQNAESRAIREPHCGGDGLRAILKLRPGVNLTEFCRRLRAIRIVQIQNGSLRESIRRAQARRVVRIAFDLGRAAFVAFHEKPDGVRPERHHRGIKLRLAKNQARSEE